ncbi:MAG: ribosomal protein L7/L12 [Pseudomonadota bacterium]
MSNGTGFDVVVTEMGSNTPEHIKLIRSFLGCSMREAHQAVHSVPLTVVQAYPQTEADNVAQEFRDIGATVDVRPTERYPYR